MTPDSNGLTVQYTYGNAGGGSGYITSITDRDAKQTSLGWYFEDTADALWGAYKIYVTDASGMVQQLERSEVSCIDTVTQNTGGDDLSKQVLTPLVGDASRTRYNDEYASASTYDRWEYQYDAGKNLTRAVRPDSAVEADYLYTSTGRMSQVTDAGGASSSFWYASSAALHPTKTRDPAGLDTPLYYDANNRQTKVAPPSSGSAGFVMAYDAYGQVTGVTNPASQTSAYAYDAFGRVTTASDPLSNQATFYYDALGRKTRSTDPRGKDTYFEYEGTGGGGCGGGRLTKVIDASSNETTFAYDKNNNKTRITNALAQQSSVSYDSMNRVTKVETPSGSGVYTTTVYDVLGRVSTKTDPDGKTVSYYYNFKGQLTKQTDGVGDYVRYTYDSAGRQSTVTDGLSHVTDYDYNGAGRLTKTTYADGKVVQYFYDSAGRKTKVGAGASGTTDPVENFYDGTTGLLTKVRYTNGGNTDDASMFYDTNGRLTKITDWNGGSYGLQYVYDNAGRVVTLKDYDNRALTYAYDAAGHITSMTDWHGYTTTYSYTDVGQVSTVTAPGSKVWDYDYNAAGRPTKVTAPNGMTTEYTYDGVSRMTKIAYKDGANTVDSFTYGFTPAANITKITHNDGSYWDYANDTRGRLTLAVRKTSGGTTQTSHAYIYDAGDNMLSKTVDAALTTFAYTVANELTSQSSGGATTTMAYDSWGRMTSKTQGGYSATYAWRYDSKLYSVTSSFPGEGTVNYQYRGDGRRHSRTVSGTTTRYNWDKGWSTVSEGDSSNNLQTTFTIDNPMAEVTATLAEIASSNPSSGTAKYYFLDHLGSTRRVHGSDKSTLATTEYQPYGATYTTTGTQPAFAFTGKPYDAAAAMHYFPRRYYSPDMARWIVRDPIGMTDGPNPYSYAGNSPVQEVDPLGLVKKRSCYGEQAAFIQRHFDLACDTAITLPPGIGFGLIRRAFILYAKKKLDWACSKENFLTVDCNGGRCEELGQPCAYYIHRAYYRTIYLCDAAWGAGLNCPPMYCTLAHELFHVGAGGHRDPVVKAFYNTLAHTLTNAMGCPERIGL